MYIYIYIQLFLRAEQASKSFFKDQAKKTTVKWELQQDRVLASGKIVCAYSSLPQISHDIRSGFLDRSFCCCSYYKLQNHRVLRFYMMRKNEALFHLAKHCFVLKTMLRFWRSCSTFEDTATYHHRTRPTRSMKHFLRREAFSSICFMTKHAIVL